VISILICDDEVEYAKILEDQIQSELTDFDISFDLAFDGIDALIQVLDKKYDLIITDHKMPKITGVEFITNMKNIESSQNKETPVIILSGFMPKVKELLGVCDNLILVEKPFNKQEIFERIRAVIS
jgi:two-component system response regulator YesN